jgi:hypothetical protein
MAVQSAPLYIVASPRPRAGKTLLARLLMEYVLDNKRPLVGFDLNAREPMLAARFPALVWPLDIGDVRGQMELFDRLVADTASTKVIDLGSQAFEQFFGVMRDIRFVEEARNRGMDTVVLFLADPAVATARTYAALRQSLPAILQPVHNEAASAMIASEDFPPTRPECGTIRLPRLSQIVRGVIDRPSFSFNVYLAHQPGGPTEIHSWIADLYAQFRDFELRLLMARLNASLRRAALAPWPPAVPGNWSFG